VMPGSTPAASLLTIGGNRSLAESRGLRSPAPLLGFWLPLPGLALLGAGFNSRRPGKKSWAALLAAMLLLLVMAQAGCGGSAGASGASAATLNSSPQSQYVTVLAASARHSHTINIFLSQRPAPGGHQR
jgi:hypothetical protein